MFATAHYAGILDEREKVYFRFDNHGIDTSGNNRDTGNLKVAVLTRNRDGKQVVRCYSVCDTYNSPGARFSERERDSLVRKIRQQNRGLRAGDLSFEQYKVCMHGKGKSQGEKGASVFDAVREDKFGKYSASEINLLRQFPRIGHRLSVKSIERRRLNRNQRGQLDRLINFVQVEPSQQGIDNFMEILASDDEENVRNSLQENILRYVTDTYNNYRAQVRNNIENRNQKFEGYGFLSGFLASFSHLYTIDVDLNLSPRNSRITFLVRHQAERDNIPIIINLATGGTWSHTALNRARGDAERLRASSFISIHTESRYAVCVGLNFNLNRIPFNVDTVELQQDRFPLVRRLFECIENEEIIEDIEDFLLQHIPTEIPINEENRDRILDCITGFAFGSGAFDRHHLQLEGGGELPVAKYVFRYDDEDLGRDASTMVLHAQGSDIVILHIRASNDIQLEAIPLLQGSIAAVGVVTYTLNDRSGINSNAVRFNTPGDYLLENRGNVLGGQLVEIPNAENVHGILEGVMNDDWQDGAQHGKLFAAISRVLMPENMNGDAIINIDSEDKFRSILHGVFCVYDSPDKVLSRYKISKTYGPERIREGVVEEVRTRVTEQRLGLLLLRRPTGNDSDTHPIGYVLGFANNAEEVEQEQDEAERRIGKLMEKERGYLPITSGNKVVLSYAVFNRGAQRAEDLISTRQPCVHKFDRRGRDLRPIEHEGIIDESPPANLLSDVTIQNLRNYRQNVRQEDQRKEKILFFQQGDNDNQCIEVRLHECSKENAIRKWIRLSAHGTIPTTQTAQDVLTQIRGILNNQQIEVSDLLTLEFATSTGYYDYWLQQIDIARAGRLQYQLHTEGNHAFEVVNLARDNQQMTDTLNQFEENAEHQRLTLIITLNNTHWVTLVIERENGNYIGYYANSSGGNVPNNVTGIVRNNLGNNVRIENVSVYQQTDGHNCGLWALENARDINQVLNQNPGRRIQNITDAIKEQLRRDDQNRNENYFRGLRRNIAQLFRDNPQDNVQLQAYHDNKGRIDPLLRTYLELGYHRVGGGYGLGEAPISLSVSDFSDLPQSSLESPEASHVSNLSKGKVGR
ncbi:cytoplasmic incompatibility factor CifB [Wolbachia endosymbiont of Drosophila baimaii]|nr:cytoplasmic incompatibility factor CifB [Wolbachia endosymbiont of Drosophila baimaii]